MMFAAATLALLIALALALARAVLGPTVFDRVQAANTVGTLVREWRTRLHCVAWDAATGLRWAQLLADLRATGRAMPVKDSLIAATALAHGLHIATRNRSDFEKAGVRLVDPFAEP